MHPGIFREYDIRGIAGQEITLSDALAIGRAYGTLLVQQGRKKSLWARTAESRQKLFPGSLSRAFYLPV